MTSWLKGLWRRLRPRPVTDPDAWYAAWKVLADHARQGCWCADVRKPCPYHEGYEAGLEDGMMLGADLEGGRTS